jgi:hypothetical protein
MSNYQDYQFKKLIDIDLLSGIKVVGDKKDYQVELINLIDDYPTILQNMSDKDLFESFIQAVGNGFKAVAFENEIIYRFSFDFDKKFLNQVDSYFSLYILDSFLSVKSELIQGEEINLFLNHFIDLVEPKDFFKNPKNEDYNPKVKELSLETFKYIITAKKEYLIGSNNDNWWHSAALYERLDWCQWLKQTSHPYLINNQNITPLELLLRNYAFKDPIEKELYSFLITEELNYKGHEKFDLYMNKAITSLNYPLFNLLMENNYHIYQKNFNADELKERFKESIKLHLPYNDIKKEQDTTNKLIDDTVLKIEKKYLEQNIENKPHHKKIKI